MTRMPIYQFNEQQRRQALTLATGRQGVKLGGTNKKFSDHTDTWVHYVGVCGEIAAAAYLGVEVDQSFSHSGDGGVDLVYGGWTIDVKSRNKKGRDLAFYPDLSDMKSKIAILAWVETNERFPIVTLPGWVRRDEIEELATIQEWLPGQPRLAIPWRSLHPMNTL